MREPFWEARLVVVLFRPPWGETNWTRVEQTAITDRCLKRGWDSLLFVVLDRTKPLPKWLPEGRIRFNFEDYGMEQAVGAVKLRTQELGGVLEKPSPVAIAKKLKEDAELRADQEKLFRDTTWAQGTARPVFENLMQLLMTEVEKIKAGSSLALESGYEQHMAGFRAVIRYGSVTLEVWWKQYHLNVIDDVPLACAAYNTRLYLQRDRKMMLREPQSIGGRKYYAVLNYARELRWIDKQKPKQLMSNEEVVDKVVEQLLALVDRADRGQIPRPDLI